MKWFMTFLLSMAGILGWADMAWGTVKIGNGGDVVDGYLARTRSAYLRTLLDFRQGNGADSVCRDVSRLSAEQSDFCLDFLRRGVDALVLLNSGANPTPLQLVEEPLSVLDPWGHPRRVRAMTECGAAGSVRFHYDSLRSLSPREAFQLLAHEFGHKIPWEDQDCVGDNTPLGPFREPGGGRAFLDAFAETLAAYAVARGHVGDDFGIVDRFRCDIVDLESGFGFPSDLAVSRIYFDPGTFRKFESGPGNLPRDPECVIAEGRSRSRLVLRVKVSEAAGCEASAPAEARFLEASLSREYDAPLNRPSEILFSQRWPGTNPLCSADPFPVGWDVLASGGRLYRMTVSYQSSLVVMRSRQGK